MEEVVISSFKLGFCPIYLKSWKRFHRDFTVTDNTRGPKVCAASVASEPRVGTGGHKQLGELLTPHAPISPAPGPQAICITCAMEAGTRWGHALLSLCP